MGKHTITDLTGEILTLTLNYPEKHNCIGFEMLEGLKEAVDLGVKENVSAMVITGAGDRSFSSGANLREFKSLDANQRKTWIRSGNELFNKIEELPFPTLALVNGYAIGGGLELAMCCDFRFGLKNAFFSSPEVRHGWLPGWGGMTRLRRICGIAKARELILLGKEWNAEEALSAGLLNGILTERQEFSKVLEPLTRVNKQAYAMAKAALSDEFRTTTGTDIWFDINAIPDDLS